MDLLLDEGGDISIAGGDLAIDGGLSSAVVIALFTDKRASADAPDNTVRGWWGEPAGDPWGSRLWELTREKTVPAVLPRIEEAARDALEWLITEGIAAEVQVEAFIVDSERVRLKLTLKRGSAPNWAELWRGVESFELARGRLSLSTVFQA